MTVENLKESIDGESYEFNTMYPGFIKNANATGNYMAQISLTYAYKEIPMQLQHPVVVKCL